MNGLEKITDKILAEATTEAENILREAETRAAAIDEEAKVRAEEIRAKYAGECDRESKAVLSRAESTATMESRNIRLHAQAEMLDGAFREAYASVLRLDADAYVKLLCDLLLSALDELSRSRRESLELYGEEGMAEIEKIEVLLNEKDAAACGYKLLVMARDAGEGRIERSMLDKLTLSDERAKIDGGLILRYGEVESNCSLALLFRDLRTSMEGQISRVLFDA